MSVFLDKETGVQGGEITPKHTQGISLGSGPSTRLKHMKSHYLPGCGLLIQQCHRIQPRSSQIHSLFTRLPTKRYELALVKNVSLDSNQKERKVWGEDEKANHREERRNIPSNCMPLLLLLFCYASVISFCICLFLPDPFAYSCRAYG